MLGEEVAALLPAKIDGTYFWVLAGITILYILVHPLITWIIATKSVKLLSYVMTSFLLLIFLLGGVVLTSIFQLPLVEVTLHSLAVFGGCLVIVHAIQHMFRNKKKRV
ncbi:hypothetical protein [Lentibacillus salinarum]|uniref:Uncharacterized protein n=1 Tax=Lentibacillus salinarum TaxID=446820 RepID=A0ABW3ZSZ5_9BACI